MELNWAGFRSYSPANAALDSGRGEAEGRRLTMTKVRALVLERQHELAIRDIDLPMETGPGQVKIKIHTVGVCGSDVHYYTHGKIGPFIVNEPMVLGHEAAGTVVEIGAGVTHLKVGDRVCMEPGIPDPNSKASRLGMYNVDPAVSFWATPPVHGVLTPEVVHPANYTFKLPDHVSFAEGAMVEPFAVGMQAATKAKIAPGDTAVVLGAGPIGTMVAIAALAGGCARAIVADLAQPKLDIAAQYQGVIPVNIREKNLVEEVSRLTDGWGADVIFECSGSAKAWETIMELPARAAWSLLSACRSIRSASMSRQRRRRRSVSKRCFATPTNMSARSPCSLPAASISSR
jgi:D-xylulose reductase